MKRIKALNGYTIYQLTARDEKNGEGYEGEYAIYFSSDIRDYGREFSVSEFDGIESLEQAEALCANNYAKAREIVEASSTLYTCEEVEAVEAKLDAGATVEELEELEEDEDDDQGQEIETGYTLTKLVFYDDADGFGWVSTFIIKNAVFWETVDKITEHYGYKPLAVDSREHIAKDDVMGYLMSLEGDEAEAIRQRFACYCL